MTAMAPMSSTTATASRNTASWTGTWRDTRLRAPRANAMSVAIGMPHPAQRLGVAGPEGDDHEDRRRNDHAAGRGEDREQGDSSLAELADRQLALDLQADDEEEQGHQPVDDEVFERERRRPVADRETDVPMPEVVVGVGRDVGPEQGDDGRDAQHRPTGVLGLDELLQRAEPFADLAPPNLLFGTFATAGISRGAHFALRIADASRACRAVPFHAAGNAAR